jgi:hypothetical protein
MTRLEAPFNPLSGSSKNKIMNKIEKQYNTVTNGTYSSSSPDIEKTLDIIIEAVNKLIESKNNHD